MPCNAFFMYLEDFFKVPFSDPLWSPKQRKKGHLQKPATKQRNKNKGYNANNTSTHLPPLEFMPHNAFSMYLEHFFKVPSSDRFHNQNKEKRAPAKTCNKIKKQKQKATMQTSLQHLPPLELMPCNAFFMYLEHLLKVPFSDPLWSPKQRKKGHLQKPATKQRNKNKGYNANNTSTHLPPLELMPRNAFLMYLEHFFKVPSSDPFHHLRKGNKSTSQKWTKTKKCSWKVM